MGINLENMTRKDLVDLRDQVEKALKGAEARERKQALKAAEKRLPSLGFPCRNFRPRPRAPQVRQRRAPSIATLLTQLRPGQGAGANPAGFMRRWPPVPILPIWKSDRGIVSK